MDMMLCNLVEGYQYFSQTSCHLKVVVAGFLEMLVQYLPTNYMVSSQTIVCNIFLLLFFSHINFVFQVLCSRNLKICTL